MERDTINQLFEAWLPVHWDIMGLPFNAYPKLFQTQLAELVGHYQAGEQDKVLNEIVDILSVAVNLFRWFRLSPRQIKDKIQQRIDTRYRGQTRDILEKYGQIGGENGRL